MRVIVRSIILTKPCVGSNPSSPTFIFKGKKMKKNEKCEHSFYPVGICSGSINGLPEDECGDVSLAIVRCSICDKIGWVNIEELED